MPDDRLDQDTRFRDSSSSTIQPLHAAMRALTGGPLDVPGIIQKFKEAGSLREFDRDDLTETLEEGYKAGFVDRLGAEIFVYRLTENGRSEIGPIIEMDLKFV